MFSESAMCRRHMSTAEEAESQTPRAAAGSSGYAGKTGTFWQDFWPREQMRMMALLGPVGGCATLCAQSCS